MKYCSRCGQQAEDFATFCFRCGFVLSSGAPDSSAAPRYKPRGGQNPTGIGNMMYMPYGNITVPNAYGQPFSANPYSQDFSSSGKNRKKKEKNRKGAGDNPSFAIGVLAFLIPILGLILYVSWKEDRPELAYSVGVGTVLGMVIWFLIAVGCAMVFLPQIQLFFASRVAGIPSGIMAG